MGKSVNKSNPYVLTDEVLNTLPSAAGSKAAQVKADNVAKNPFVLSTEVLNTIPEKKKTFDTGLTESSPSESESELASKENATDFLLQDIDGNDFFSQLAKQTERYFPQTTPGRVNQQAAEMTKQEVFRNPGSLQRYADGRIKKLREEIANLKQDQRESLTQYSSEFAVSPSLTEGLDIKRDYSKNDAQILEKENYLNKFKSSVADIAAGILLSQQDLTSFNPRTIGREIVKIADPEQEQVFNIAEKNGQTLPGIRQAELERVGLNAVKEFVLKSADIPNRDNIITRINEYERDFDTRNFEATGQRVREKIGAQLYKEGRSGFFGFGYPASTLQEAANNPATGLTASERKVFEEYVLPLERKIIGTDIPTSGFTRGFYNAIEKGTIGMGKTMADIAGIRDESEQAQDLLNQEVDMSRYRPAGENPNAAAQLSFLQKKEKTGRLTDSEKTLKKELENYTYVRNGWSKFKDGVGDLTGQVALIALATKGIGATGQALKLSGASGGLLGGMTRSTLGTALSNETVGLFVSSYLNSFDNYKQQAIELMPGDDKAANRNAYATVMASVEALSERIFRDTKILDAFTKGTAPAIRDITNKLISGEITQQVARQETQNALTAALKPFAKEYAKATFQESTEEAVVDFAQGAADAVFGGEDFDIVKTGQQALNTFLTTALYSPIVSGMAAAGATRRNRSQNAFIKSAIVDMAANPAPYLKSVEDLQVEGAINQQQANEKIQLIKSANQYLQEVPISRKITAKVGEGETAATVEQEKSFDYPETTSYLLHRLNEGILTDKINNTTDEVLKSRLQKDLKRNQEIRKGLFDGTIGVTTDLQDVTNNPEKAADLGIANTDELTADVLVGTPFERETENVPRETVKPTDEKEPENQAAEVAPTEGETASTQSAQGQAPQITEEQRVEAAQFANELKNEGVIPDTYQDMITEENADPFWKFVAQQAQNVDENWQPLEGQQNKSEQATIDAFGETVVNYAKELYPIDKTNSATTIAKELEDNGNWDISDLKNEENQSSFLKEAIQRVKEGKRSRTNESVEIHINDNGSIGIDNGNHRIAEALINGENNIKVTVVNAKKISESYRKAKIDGTNPELVKVVESLLNRSKTKQNENEISQEASAQEDAEEINVEENADEAIVDEEADVLTEQGVEPGAETPFMKEERLSDKGKQLANKIRSLKIKRDVAQSDIFGIGTSLYNTSIDIVAYGIEQGANLATAIGRAVEYIKTNYGGSLDEDAYRKHIEEGSTIFIKTKEELTNTLNEINETYNTKWKDSKVYRFVDFRQVVERSDLSAEEIKESIRKSKITSKDKNKVEKYIEQKAKKIADAIRELKRNRSNFDVFNRQTGAAVPTGTYTLSKFLTEHEVSGNNTAKALLNNLAKHPYFNGVKLYVTDRMEQGVKGEAIVTAGIMKVSPNVDAETLAHEMMHFLTSKIFTNPYETLSPSEKKLRNDVNKIIKEFDPDLSYLDKTLGKLGYKRPEYAQEIIAEAFTGSWFAKELEGRQVKVIRTKRIDKNLIQKIIDKIISFFGGQISDSIKIEEKANVVEALKLVFANHGSISAQRLKELNKPTGKYESLKSRTNIFGVSPEVYDGALETIATSVEQGAALVDAINQGIKYIRDNGGANLDEAGFIKHIEDQASGIKPKIKVQIGKEEAETKQELPKPPKLPKTEQEEPEGESIENYRMTTSGEVGRFMSGDTWEDVFGEAPEGNQNYQVQALTDMLQDGKNMIAIAQQRWGADEMMYGRPLFQLIQSMSNDAQLTNKKAVLLATFLGELQEAKLRSPERFDAINQLEKAVFAYYQNYMNLRGKEVVAGRLLRLYRDKYVGDVFSDRILEKEQVKAKKKIQEAEQKKNIDDATAQGMTKAITEEEKLKEDKAAKEKTKKAKKDQGKKKKLTSDEAKQKADQKLSDIQSKLGSEAKKGLIGRIKDAINKLNCK